MNTIRKALNDDLIFFMVILSLVFLCWCLGVLTHVAYLQSQETKLASEPVPTLEVRP